MREVLLAQLGVLRAQIGGLQAQVDAMGQILEANDPAPVSPASCAHLETENVGTFGAPAEKCVACGAFV